MSVAAMEAGSGNDGTVTESSVPDQSSQQTTPAVTENVTSPEPTGLDRLRELAKGDNLPKSTEKTAKTDPKTTPATPGEKPAGDAVLAPKDGEKPPFVANYKFKVMDKEHEIPEALRSAMKDPETEKLVRELHEKAYGLDIVKPKFIEERRLHQEAKTQNSQLLGGINELRVMYQRNDLDGFFKKLAVPQEKILQWVVDKLNYNDLPQDQKQVLDQRKTAEERAWQAEQQVQTLQEKFQTETLNARELQLQSTLDRAEFKAAAEAFDSRPGGKPGDFREAVCERGETTWIRSQGKVDLSPEQAVQEVIRLYGIQPAAPAAAMTAAPAAAPAVTATPVAAPKTPVIPNVAGGSTSPMKAGPRSISDLKKLAAQMQ